MDPTVNDLSSDRNSYLIALATLLVKNPEIDCIHWLSSCGFDFMLDGEQQQLHVLLNIVIEIAAIHITSANIVGRSFVRF